MQSVQNNGCGSSCAGQRGEGSKQRQTQPTSGTKPHLSPWPPHPRPVPTSPPAGPPSVLGSRRWRCLHSRVPAGPTSRAGSGLSAPEARSGQVGVLESSPAFPVPVLRASARHGERLLCGASRFCSPGSQPPEPRAALRTCRCWRHRAEAPVGGRTAGLGLRDLKKGAGLGDRRGRQSHAEPGGSGWPLTRAFLGLSCGVHRRGRRTWTARFWARGPRFFGCSATEGHKSGREVEAPPCTVGTRGAPAAPPAGWVRGSPPPKQRVKARTGPLGLRSHARHRVGPETGRRGGGSAARLCASPARPRPPPRRRGPHPAPRPSTPQRT